jgi:tetratricopeptide (TPR) repeat protein
MRENRGAAGDAEPGVLEALAAARRLARSGAPDAAQSLLLRLVGETAGPVEVRAALVELLLALLAGDRVTEALAAFDQALALDDHSAAAHLGLGLAYHRQGRWREAVVALEAAERMAPGRAIAPLNLALALEALGQLELARAAILRAAALAPEDQEVRGALERLVPQTSARRLGSSLLPGIGLFDVLELLRLHRKSGSLAINSPQGNGEVQIWRGAITSASAPALEPLARLLARRELLDPARFAPGELEDDAEALGRLLLDGSRLDRAQLGRLFLGRILDSLAEMSAWADGTYAFRPREVSAPPPISFSVKHVILELVSRSDEALRSGPVRGLPQ